MSDLSDGLKQGWYDSRPRGKDLEVDFKINTNRAYWGHYREDMMKLV